MMKSLFGKDDKTVPLETANEIHKVLSASDKISHLKWHGSKDWADALENQSKGLTDNIGSNEPF